jgi:hypothetical protein
MALDIRARRLMSPTLDCVDAARLPIAMKRICNIGVLAFMWRLIIGLVVGIAGGVAISLLNTDGYLLVAPLVALGAGLTLGLLLGWKREGPLRALGGGTVAGGLAGLLIAASQLAGLWQSSANPLAPDWLRSLTPNDVMFRALAAGTTALCLLLVMVPAGALAGIVSAWTGYRRDPRRAAGATTNMRLMPTAISTSTAQAPRASGLMRAEAPALETAPTQEGRPPASQRLPQASQPAAPNRPRYVTPPVPVSQPSRPPQASGWESEPTPWLLPGSME